VGGLWALVGVANFFKVGVENLFLDQSFQLKILFCHQNCTSHSFGRFVGVVLGGLWALEWAWETNIVQLKFFSQHEHFRRHRFWRFACATGLGGLLALEWAWRSIYRY